MHFCQVVAQGHIALAGQGVFQRLRCHIGVAVAVPANPLAHAQKAGNGLAGQGFFQLGIKLGDFAQKSRFVIAQRVLDLVGHREFGEAQQAGLPQLHHSRTDLLLIGRQFFGRQGVFSGIDGGSACLDGIALGQQVGDVTLSVQNAFALHLGGVRGEHWGHVAGGQHVRDAFGRDACPAQPLQRHIDAALLRVASPLVDGAAADVVAVFGQVGQVAEISKGTDHAHGAVTRQAFEQFLQGFVGLLVGVAPESHRELANLLNQFISLWALLRADHIAQNSTEQPDVFDQRTFTVAFVVAGFGGADMQRGSGGFGDLFHRRVCGEGVWRERVRGFWPGTSC